MMRYKIANLQKTKDKLTVKLKEVNKCLYYLNLENFKHEPPTLYDDFYEDYIYSNYTEHIIKIKLKKEKSHADIKNLINYALTKRYITDSRKRIFI